MKTYVTVHIMEKKNRNDIHPVTELQGLDNFYFLYFSLFFQIFHNENLSFLCMKKKCFQKECEDLAILGQLPFEEGTLTICLKYYSFL